jgi:hypothetical protein
MSEDVETANFMREAVKRGRDWRNRTRIAR